MRLSLLAAREDFGTILEITLARYLAARTGQPHMVRWSRGSSKASGAQRWDGNTYLNFFTVDATPADHLEIIRREFTRSRSIWRRPLQALYVRAATSRASRRYLANAAFSVQPAMPDAVGALLVPGNHRIRLLWPAAGKSILLLKHGFSPSYLAAEVAARRGPAASLAPQLIAVAEDETWLEEQYLEGTPINRLAPAEEQACRIEASDRLQRELIQPTLEGVNASTWAGDIERRIVSALAAAQSRISGPETSEIVGLARRWRDKVRQSGSGVVVHTALTHGDFQPGNILRAGGRLWVIDWEGAARRVAFYDPACLALNLRLNPAWTKGGERMDDGCAGTIWARLQHWAGVDWTAVPRSTQFALFVMEELWFVLHDALDPNFRDVSGRLRDIGRRFASLDEVIPLCGSSND